MSSPSFIPRKVLVLGIVLPLAALVGYLLSSPDFESLAVIGLFAAVLGIPLFLRWHHAILVGTMNLAITAFFLPGNPPFWMLAAAISLTLTLANRILDKKMVLPNVPSVTWSLIVLALVVLFTMKMTSGLGLRSLGGNVYGGRKYVFILAGIAAYFALSANPIPLPKVKAYLGSYMLTGVSPILSHLIYFLGPSMWVLYALFSVDWAMTQNYEEVSAITSGVHIGRLTGFGPAGLALLSYMLVRFGVQGILDWRRPWRLGVCALTLAATMLGGFRSSLLLFAAVLVIQFYLEGLHRTRILPALLVVGALLLAAIIPISDKLPLPVQRCLSILPLKVDAMVRYDAMASTDWRLRIWELLLPDVPKYLFIGKGCAASATDYFLAIESVRRGYASDYEMTLVSGDYHNGPLSVLVPFGLPGTFAFVWFLGASIRVLVRNYRHGDPALSLVNTFLLSMFIARVVFFVIVFGGMHSDLIYFAGIVGLSVSVNRGMCKAKDPEKASTKEAAAALISLRPARA